VEDAMKFRLGRKLVDLKTLQAELNERPEHVVAFGSGMPDSKVGFGFSEWSELIRFMKRSPHAEAIINLDERRRKLRSREGEDIRAVKARLALKSKRIAADMQELSKRTGLPLYSKELFSRATIKADPLEGSIFDPAIVFTGTGFNGQGFFVGYPGTPDFSWFNGPNNNISSLRGFGALALFSGTWYQGASRLFLGAFSNANLAGIGFNNVASSALVD
jgi:hypothetical protein